MYNNNRVNGKSGVTDAIVERIRDSDSSFNINQIPLEDKKTFAPIRSGQTENIVMLESDDAQKLCVELEVASFNDLIAVELLARPGPEHLLQDFLRHKKGYVEPKFDLPEIKSVVEDTYGLILYQEQIIEIIHRLSEMPRNKADLARRAMGKKKVSDVIIFHDMFKHGCENHGLSDENIESIWDWLFFSSGFAYLKAHAKSTALVTYRMAYLKANYPDEFSMEFYS